MKVYIEVELPLGRDDRRLCPEKVRDLRMDRGKSHDLGLPFTLPGAERGETHTWASGPLYCLLRGLPFHLPLRRAVGACLGLVPVPPPPEPGCAHAAVPDQLSWPQLLGAGSLHPTGPEA